MTLSRSYQAQGFSLIEVVVALAIISLAFTAILQATSQTARNILYLENKTTAYWVGLEAINECRIGLKQLPLAPSYASFEKTMLSQSWIWQGQLIKTANPKIHKIHVAVLETTSRHKLIDLTSYLVATTHE